MHTSEFLAFEIIVSRRLSRADVSPFGGASVSTIICDPVRKVRSCRNGRRGCTERWSNAASTASYEYSWQSPPLFCCNEFSRDSSNWPDMISNIASMRELYAYRNLNC